jgi:hypothetical protein
VAGNPQAKSLRRQDMSGWNIDLSKDVDIESAVTSPARELSSSALAYIALALGVILTLVWFVALTWIFALLLG